MKLTRRVHTALDELRMQMLGAQVLFGFQFQGMFREGFDHISEDARTADVVAAGLLVATIGFLLAPCAQHRLVERGISSQRIIIVSARFTELALCAYALAIGLDVFAISEGYFGTNPSLAVAALATVLALALWFALGGIVRVNIKQTRTPMPEREEPPLYEKIDQMLTESRVILPGAQALLGFQFVVTMTQTFPSLPQQVKDVHFIALAMVLLSVMLLLASAAVHRLAFRGEDTERMLDIGSRLVTAALVPLAAGIAGDVYVAIAKSEPNLSPWTGSIGSFVLLFMLWYAFPLALRSRGSGR